MHELSVCQSLLREAERVAADHGAARIVRLSVVVGPLSGVEAPLLERAFEVGRAGTRAEDATLDIETAPVTVWCAECDCESVVPSNALLCVRCGGWRVMLRSGAELLLKQVELAAREDVE